MTVVEIKELLNINLSNLVHISFELIERADAKMQRTVEVTDKLQKMRTFWTYITHKDDIPEMLEIKSHKGLIKFLDDNRKVLDDCRTVVIKFTQMCSVANNEIAKEIRSVTSQEDYENIEKKMDIWFENAKNLNDFLELDMSLQKVPLNQENSQKTADDNSGWDI